LRSKGDSNIQEGALFNRSTLRFHDPDQLVILLVEDKAVNEIPNQAFGDVADEHSIRGFFGATLDVPDIRKTAELLEEFGWKLEGSEGKITRYSSEPDSMLGRYIDLVQAQSGAGRFGKGSIHHIAFRVPNSEMEEKWRLKLLEMGYQPTVAQERFYFRSIYFREKGGILFEIATDEPGFTADENLEELGSDLKLPPWYEPHRARIEESLPEL
jgi:glyoxalase family protein